MGRTLVGLDLNKLSPAEGRRGSGFAGSFRRDRWGFCFREKHSSVASRAPVPSDPSLPIGPHRLAWPDPDTRRRRQCGSGESFAHGLLQHICSSAKVPKEHRVMVATGSVGTGQDGKRASEAFGSASCSPQQIPLSQRAGEAGREPCRLLSGHVRAPTPPDSNQCHRVLFRKRLFNPELGLPLCD